MSAITIVGASQGIGLACGQLALAGGHEVRTISRRLPSLPASSQLKVFQGSVLDADVLSRAVEGTDAVVLTLGHPFTRKPVKLFSEGTRAVVAAVRTLSARAYLLAVTGIGAGDSKGRGGFLYDKVAMPLFLATIYEDKTRQEEIVRKSGLAWTIVRPGFVAKKTCAEFLISEALSRKCISQDVFVE